MKCYPKRVLFTVICLVCVSFILWNSFVYNEITKHTPSETTTKSSLTIDDGRQSLDESKLSPKLTKRFQSIDCFINEEYSIPCIKSQYDSAVYVPFNFIRKYFEISGKIAHKKDGKELFLWQHSYSKVYYPHETYDYKKVFLWFENYNVEVRERVKCVSAIEGVPMSTQWEPKGHFYPIQIAQFGLSHFSKNLTYGKPRITELETGESLNKRFIQYNVPNGAMLSRVSNDQTPYNKVLLIDGHNIVLKLKRKPNSDLTLGFQIKPLSNFSLTAVLKEEINSLKEYTVRYMTIDEHLYDGDSEVIYGIGSDFKWKSLTRDIGVDLQKGYAFLQKKLEVKPRNLHLIRLEFNGKALLDNIRLFSSAHEEFAKVSADWLINNQDSSGGWSIKVTRKLSNGVLVLNKGWYSAMGQGQAISLLTRMYHATGDVKYLNSASKAIDLFYVNSTKNGIRTYFIDKYVWFEEYPTVPSSYVLNGFIYSLFGLYDLKMSCNDEPCQKAGQLFDSGIMSLKKMLPLYDSGSGSIYDLRHFMLGSAPNLARWDYHTTHINQLLFLNTIDSDLIFQTTAKRWISYMKGKRAPHN